MVAEPPSEDTGSGQAGMRSRIAVGTRMACATSAGDPRHSGIVTTEIGRDGLVLCVSALAGNHEQT